MPASVFSPVAPNREGRRSGPRAGRSAARKPAAPILLAPALLIASTSAAASLRGVVSDADQARVDNVVVAVPADAPPAFADRLKEALLKESALYGASGRPLVLKADIQKVHFKNGLKAMFGDIDRLTGTVTVLDPATSQPQGNFKVDVSSNPPSNAGSTLLGILSFVDPTGLIGMGQMLSKTGGGVHAKAEYFMCVNFANSALKQTLGGKRAKVADAARRQNAQAAAAEAKRTGASPKAAAAAVPSAEQPAAAQTPGEPQTPAVTPETPTPPKPQLR